MTYWHGGPNIRQSHIWSSQVTGRSRSGDRGVFVTTDRTLAEAYASTVPHGWVYEVIPDGALEPVPSLVGGQTISFRCASALIVRRFTVPRHVRDAYRAAILPMLGALP